MGPGTWQSSDKRHTRTVVLKLLSFGYMCYMYVSMFHMYICTCRSQRVMLGIFLNFLLPYFLRLSFSLNPKLTALDFFVSETLGPSSHCLDQCWCYSVCTATHCYSLCCRGPELSSSCLHSKNSHPLSHLPSFNLSIFTANFIVYTWDFSMWHYEIEVAMSIPQLGRWTCLPTHIVSLHFGDRNS